MSILKDYSDFGIHFNGTGEEVSTQCPQCSKQRKKKRTKCLSINTDKECWICHHCGWTGSLKKGAYYSDPHYQKPEYRKPKFLTADPKIIPAVVEWFNSRGISNNTQIRNRVTVAKIYMPQVEKEVKAIGIPYYRDGEHINTKWRDHDKNFRLEAGAELILFGLDDIKDAEVVIWVEGEMDKLSVEEAGFINCVSIPNGAPPANSKNYSSHFDYLLSAEQWLSGKKHVLFVDADEPGRRLEDELSRRLGKEFCTRVRLPDEYKDANEYLVAQGREALADVIGNAKPFPVTGIHEVKSLAGAVKNLKKDGMPGGVKTGWVVLDQFYSIRPAELTIITGIPNHGKSNFLDCLLLNIAKVDGWRFGLFSPENQPLELHAAGLCEKYNNKAFVDLGDDYLDATLDWLQDHFYWVLPDLDDDWSLVGILEKAKILVYRHGINGFVIDPWNEIEHRRPSGVSETEYISWALSRIRQFGNLHNVHMFVIAHPTKLKKDDKTGMYPVPRPYDIAGSNAWLAKADNCLAVYRHFTPGMESRVDIYVQKIRFKEIGKVGMASLTYDECNYRELSHFDGEL